MTKLVFLLLLTMCLTAACTGVAPLRPPAQESTPPSSPSAEINRALIAASGQSSSVATTDYRLGPQDRVEITLFNVPIGETGVTPRVTEVRISQRGKIVLPLLGAIDAGGLTTTTLESELRTRYQKYLHDPQVGVQVKEYHSQPVSVIGAVQRPGVFELTGPKTIIDLLAQAGGVTEKAGTQLHLLRKGASGPQRYIVDLRSLASSTTTLNVPVVAEDVIDVPRAGTFFVDGAVNKPGAYPLERPYTVTQALATAGGLNHKEAKLSGVLIFRHRDFHAPETIPVRVGEVLAGEIPDPVVEANDVVFVPTSTPKYIVQRILDAIGMGLTVPLR